MTPWFMLIFVLIVSITLFLWMNKKKNVEGFGAFFDNQYIFGELQRKYFHDQAGKEIITNLDLDVSNVNGAFNQADMYLQTSPDRDFSVYFRPEDNKYTKQDESVCRAAPHPRNLKRSPRTTTGCGWWYVADPSKPSCGALGTRQGPLFPETLRSTYPGGRWVWDLKEAGKLEDIKMCRRITTCEAINADGIKGNCAFCAEKGWAVPINPDGSLKYPDDDVGGGCDASDMAMSADKCPRFEDPAVQGVGGGITEDTEFDVDGNPVPPSSADGKGPIVLPRIPVNVCDPFNGRLTRECLRSLARSMGMSDGGAVIRMIMRAEKPNEMDKVALEYMKNIGIIVPESVLGSGTIDRDTASSTYKRIVDAQNHSVMKVREGAKYLASGNENFDICYMADDEEGPFPEDCMVREFRKAGCQQSGKAAPVGANASRYAGLTWGQMKDKFGQLFSSMKSTDPTIQDKAIADCIGTVMYREPPEVCDEPGIEYMVYSWDSYTKQPSAFLGRVVSKQGFLREKDGNGPWASRSALSVLLNKSEGRPYFRARTKVQPKRQGTVDLQGWAITNSIYVTQSSGKDGLGVLVDPVVNGKWDNLTEYKWSIPIFPNNVNKIEMVYKAETTNFSVPHSSSYVTENLNSFQLMRDSWRPVVSFDFYKGSDEDVNGAVQRKVFGGSMSTVGSRKVYQFDPKNNGIELSAIHTDVIGTITAMVYVDTVLPTNSCLWVCGIGNGGDLQILTSGRGGIHFAINNYGAGQQTVATVENCLKPKSWVHFGFVMHGDRKGVDVYINGTKQTSVNARSTVPLPSLTTRTMLGAWGFGYAVAWLHVYDQYLTEPEVQRDMNYDNESYVMTVPEVPYIVNRAFTYTLHPAKNAGPWDYKVVSFDKSKGEDTNLNKCIDACGEDPKCVAFTMVPDGNKHNCFLKGRLGPFTPHASTTLSGRIHRPYYINAGNKEDYLVDVSNVSRNPGASVWAWKNWDGPNQKWTMDDNNTLKSVNSGMCLDVSGWRTDPGAPIQQYPCHGGGNQRWILDDQQRLHPQHAPDKCLEVDNSQYNSAQDGGKMYINDCKTGQQNQRWGLRSAEK